MKDQDIVCPFCKSEDFDLIGLKHHFMAGYCEEFNNTEDLPIFIIQRGLEE